MGTVYGEVIDVQKSFFFMTTLNSINKIYKIFWTISHFSYTSREQLPFVIVRLADYIDISYYIKLPFLLTILIQWSRLTICPSA